MKIISCKHFPPKGFCAINIFGVMFARTSCTVSATTINHEEIHTAQMKELGYIFFYIIYFLEWLYRLVFHTATAYRGISFEVEAYLHQSDYGYLENRKHFAQWRRTSTNRTMEKNFYEIEIAPLGEALERVPFDFTGPKIHHCAVVGEPARCETDEGLGWTIPVRRFRTALGAWLYRIALNIKDKMNTYGKRLRNNRARRPVD